MDSEMTDQTTLLPVRRALISVSDKTGVLDFARELAALGVEILSTVGNGQIDQICHLFGMMKFENLRVAIRLCVQIRQQQLDHLTVS